MELYGTLPFTFFLVLVELILGTAVAMLLVEPRREVGPGFFQFMGVSLVVTVLLAIWTGAGLRQPVEASGLAAIGPLQPLYGALAASILYSIFSFRPLAAARIAAGLALVATSALSLGGGLAALGPSGMGTLIAASFAAASLAMGSSMTAMLLGHWYLVAPMLSSAPLIRLTTLMLVVLVAQAALLIWMLGGGDQILERLGIVIAMRAGFGIAFPLFMGAFVWYACRIRAMRTATGILYLAVGCVVMGDIAAKVIYFLTAVPV